MNDKRLRNIVFFVFATLVLGTVFSLLPQSFVTGHKHKYQDSAQDPSYWRSDSLTPKLEPQQQLQQPTDYVSGALDPAGHAKTAQQNQQLQAFNDAVTLMQYGHPEAALVKWHEFIGRYPNVVEAQVNLGYTFIALEQWDFARSALEHALDLNSNQANAYYGLALVAEAGNELRLAKEYMQTFLHLEHDKAFDNKARAALWLWEEKLKPDYVSQNTVTEKDVTEKDEAKH
ncbi:tetratricopeptide repeat protein [Shewanella cyperi]|uniref:tetratricopeptide repeat protein n=1 Tax=Shewanella cyperi TaxID=2814292 RepID=UPI001A945E02|nr:tetratricopeptide repeat protein [Shewanella cyperi]QSX41280.1 tetratricopeptide repeat protein [Shewanella cyperi]